MEDADHLAAIAELIAYLEASNYRFVTPTPATHSVALQRAATGTSLRDAFGWSRDFPPELLPDAMRTAWLRAGILRDQGGALRSLVRISSLDGVLFVHSAYPTSDAASVFFGPDTYRFAAAVKRWLAPDLDVARVADVGAGTGAAGILIARERPDARVDLIDINPQALDFAMVNARSASVANVAVVHSDLLDATSGDYDLVISNPPYMADCEKRSYRDGGGSHGTALSLRIVRECIPRLAPGGTLLLYTGAPVVDGDDLLLRELRGAVESADCAWTYEELDPDVFGEELHQPPYANVERIAAVLLTLRKAST